MKELKNKGIRCGLYLIIAVGLVSHVMPYLFQRSLWIDEARLASSIVNRSFWNLTASPLDAGQSAPIGYLYIVKLFTMIFGTGEAALRLWSLLSFCGCAAVFWQIVRKIIRTERWMIYLAVFVTIPVYIYYGNELKPYMSDCFFVLLSVLLYCLYQEGRWSIRRLSGAYAVMIWFSFAAVLYIAGGMILICIQMLLNAVRKKTAMSTVLGSVPFCLLVLVSFVLNYVIWLSATSSNAEGQGYWELLAFPLIPTSLSDISRIGLMVEQVLMPFGTPGVLFAVLVIVKVLWCIRKHRIQVMDQYLLMGILLMLAASWMGFYPIQGRMVLFVSMTMLLFTVDIMEEIMDFCAEKQAKAYRFLLEMLGLFLFLIYLFGDLSYWRPGGVYMVGSEISGNLQYLADHKIDGDMIYVRNEAIPAFLYEMDYPWGDVDLVYDTPVIRDDCIFGQPTFSYFYEIPYSYEGEPVEEAVLEDVRLIEAYDSVYIYTSHEIAEKKEDTQELLRLLRKSGTVEIAACYYETYLYHYSKTASGR